MCTLSVLQCCLYYNVHIPSMNVCVPMCAHRMYMYILWEREGPYRVLQFSGISLEVHPVPQCLLHYLLLQLLTEFGVGGKGGVFPGGSDFISMVTSATSFLQWPS